MGSFTQILGELYTMIEYTDDNLQRCVFNTNHASNYMSLKGELGKDKQAFLQTINKGIEYVKKKHPELI